MPRLTVPIYRVELVREGRQDVVSRSVSSPDEAATIFRDYIGNRDREVFAVMALSTQNRVLGVSTVSIGTLENAHVHPRELYKSILLLNAASIIVAHNHPSGAAAPSQEDRLVTTRIVEAGRLLGIQVQDHIILGEGTIYTSLRERGMM
jgi:DNA repair protein RadC